MSSRAIGPLLCAAALILAATAGTFAEDTKNEGAGVRARVDGNRGVWKAPAGIAKTRPTGDTSNTKTRARPGKSKTEFAPLKPAEF